MNQAPLLRIAGATLQRGGRILLQGFDLQLDAGEAAVLTGPNGVGKSSLIRMAAGLIAPVAGTVERQPAALADEGLALEGRQSLASALGFWTRMDGGDLQPALADMGLLPLAPVPVGMLSTGQRKRAMLARVIASGAPLWLLDEPANGLDADGRARLEQAVARHRAGGGAVLLATHQPVDLPGARAVQLA